MDEIKTRTVYVGNHWRRLKKYICIQCGKEFESRADMKCKYCSYECYHNAIRTGRKTYSRICQHCGKPYQGRTETSKYCSAKCQNLARIGKNHPLYKCGYSMDDGYRKVLSGKGGYVKEHRRKVEEVIGRKLDSEEIIHHINGDRADNRIDNLTILTRSEHLLIHHFLRGQGHITAKEYEAIINKGKERITNGI